MAKATMTPDLLAAIADRFKAIGEPARLQILYELRADERTVSELVERTGMGQANVSKHLQLLHAHGFVARRKEGLFTWYRLADAHVFRLCDIMCGSLERNVSARQKLIGSG